MKNKLNRRSWLKAGSVLAAGLAYQPFSSVQATPQAAPMQPLPFFTPEYEYLPADLGDIPPIRARLGANENPFGPAESAKKAIIDAINDSFMYPRDGRQELIDTIAKIEGVAPEQVLIGAGSTELLMAAALYYSQGGGSIISGDPSYLSLVSMASKYGATWEKVPLTKDFDLDLPAMEKRVSDKTSLVYICNPNNPTGKLLNPDQLSDFCASVSPKKPVFVDEAYIDYAGDAQKLSAIANIKKGQNVIVARTFSKVHAFAGLRIGYCIGLPETIEKISMYSTRGGTTAATSVYGAIASLQDQEFLKFSVEQNEISKKYIYGVLKNMGYTCLPSATNFVLFPIKMKADGFRKAMLEKGVAIRTWEFDGQTWCRVSMHTLEKMKIFEEAFKEVVA